MSEFATAGQVGLPFLNVAPVFRRFSVKKALLLRLCTSLLARAAFGQVPQSTRPDTWPARTVQVVIPFIPGMGHPMQRLPCLPMGSANAGSKPSLSKTGPRQMPCTTPSQMRQ